MVLNWLITGGCGFIGRSLISHLIAQGGHNVRVLDDLSVGTTDDLAGVCEFNTVTTSESCRAPVNVELLVGDIRDADVTNAAGTGCNVIVHLAANTGVGPSVADPRLDCDKNVFGTLNMLESARANDIKRFIFASSGAPIGETVPPIHEEMVPHPVSPYGASKLAGEAYCSAYYRCYGVETVALRFGNVYGPGSGRKESVVAKFISRALDGKVLEIYGDGTQTRDFVFVSDLVQAISQASEVDNIGGEVFQIATSQETTLNEMVERMLRVFKTRGINVPEVKMAEVRTGDVMRNFSDTSKAKRLLGWEANTSLDDGLVMTVNDFLNTTESKRHG